MHQQHRLARRSRRRECRQPDVGLGRRRLRDDGRVERRRAQSGTVTITVAGGKVTATITTVPSKGSIGMATGTISGTVTCP